MIRFSGMFMRYRLPDSNSPSGPILKWKKEDSFWCSFDVGTQQIMCRITYKENVDCFECFRYYKCLISLPYGEKFPPNSPETKEYPGSIDLSKEYNLNYGAEVFGKCILKEIVEIIPDYYGTID